MNTYTATYGHADNCIPGLLTLDATNDQEAVTEVRQIAAQGYRNESWCSVELSNGSNYVARA